MKYKLISFIAIFFSIFCLSRSALASCSTDTDSGFSVCTDSYSDNGTWKTRKYVDVSSFEISVGPDSDWEINSDVSSKKALLKTLIQTKQKLPPPAAFTQSEFHIYVNGDAEYMINCQSNIGGIPCNDPKIRLVMKITISIQGNYVMEDITTDDGTKLPVGGGYYLYGFKKFGDAVEIVRLTPVSKPSSIKYTFTSYTALTSEFSCLFETIPVGNSVTSISFTNEKATITILKNDPSLSINCLFALPEGETVSASQDLTLFWNTFETGNYVDSLQEDSTHLYVVNFLTETTKHVTFHNNVQFTIFKDDLPYGISAIFTTLPSATTSTGGYAVGLDTIPYSTVLKFTLKGIICPDETTKKVNGVCPDSTCPANTPKWDLAKDKCVADCTENSNVTTTTGYGPDPDHDDTCKCSDTNFPNLDTTNKW